MEYITLYRVEHDEKKHGMWYNNDCVPLEEAEQESILEKIECDRLLKMPMPYSDRYRKDGKEWKCSTDTVEMLYHWFRPEDIRAMVAEGYDVKMFESNDYIIEDNQVLFAEGSRRNEQIITEKFI